MRNVIATICQIIGVVGLVTAGWLWCLPAGIAATSIAIGAAGYMVDPTR